jgi:hypothetical protein
MALLTEDMPDFGKMVPKMFKQLQIFAVTITGILKKFKNFFQLKIILFLR